VVYSQEQVTHLISCKNLIIYQIKINKDLKVLHTTVKESKLTPHLLVVCFLP